MPGNKNMVRRLLATEAVAFTSTSKLFVNDHSHIVISSDLLLAISNSLTQKMPTEDVVPVPMSACVWLVDAMTTLLLPLALGGVPADQLSLTYTEAGRPSLRLRRIPSVEAQADPGFDLGNCKDKHPLGGLISVQWSDRLLFDGGLYPVLLRIASEWALKNSQPGPRKEANSLRPNWMGKGPAETPPLLPGEA